MQLQEVLSEVPPSEEPKPDAHVPAQVPHDLRGLRGALQPAVENHLRDIRRRGPQTGRQGPRWRLPRRLLVPGELLRDLRQVLP